MKISRRQFVEASALGCAATLLSGPSLAETKKMPMRAFGKTARKSQSLLSAREADT